MGVSFSPWALVDGKNLVYVQAVWLGAGRGWVRETGVLPQFPGFPKFVTMN